MEINLNPKSQSDIEVMAGLVQLYRDDSVFFVEHALGHYTWSKQRDILESVRDNPRTAVRACHGASKTYTAAEVAVWFLNVFPQSKVITTAPTHPQVELLLWSEINQIYRTSRIPMIGKCLRTMIRDEADDTHYAVGFSTDKPERAEGWHSPFILFIFDEAKGIPQWLWDSVKGLMTGGFCRWLAISTTDGVEVGEQYHKIFNESETKWNKIHISAYDSPYVTGEPFQYIKMGKHLLDFQQLHIDPESVIIQIANMDYIEDCKDDWGEDSVLYQTKVLGELSDQAADTVIKLSQVNKMFQNAKNPDFDEHGKAQCGVDVARGGQDDTVFYLRKGLKIIRKKVIQSPDLPPKARLVFIADELEVFLAHDKDCETLIDDTGVGGGLTDVMEDRKYNITPINFNEVAKNQDKYPNRISEMWFEAAASIHEMSCPEDSRLQGELLNRKYLLDKKGRRMIESKIDYKKRGFRSPDVADAFLLAFYEAEATKPVFVLAESPW